MFNIPELKIVKHKFLLLLPALFILGCEPEQPMKSTSMTSDVGTEPSVTPTAIKLSAKFSTVQKGFKLYRANCASCHGDQGQGAANWRQTGADGKQPAPPLNGTGHTWHHPMPVLVSTIKNGTQRIGGNMPPWKDRLSNSDINAIILWFQSRWPDELYQAWARMDREAAQSARK